MSSSGMPLTLANGNITRIAEGVDTLNVQNVVPSITNADLEVASNGTGELRFATNGVRAVTIDANQRVGIGISTLLTAQLNVEAALAANEIGLKVEQKDTTNNPHAVIITNAGSGSALELAGAGRKINSTSGNLTVATATLGNLYLTSADNVEMTGDSIKIETSDVAGYLEVTGKNSLSLSGESTVEISSVDVLITPFDTITGTFFRVDHGGTYLGSSTGTDIWTKINAGIDQSGDAGYTVLAVNADIIAAGTGVGTLLDVQLDTASKFSVRSDGSVHVTNKITADAGNLSLEGFSAATSFNDAGNPSLVGYTATSVIGALNEAKTSPVLVKDTRFIALVDAGSIAQYELVGANATASTGHVRLSDADGGTKNCVGVCITPGPVAAGNEITIASGGRATVKTSDVGAWTMTAPVYMSTIAGEATSDVSGLVAGNISQQIGFAIDTSTGSTREVIISLGPVVEL